MEAGSKIPTFGASSAKFSRPLIHQTKISSTHTKSTSELKTGTNTVYRSHSRDAIITKRKSSLLHRNDFNSRSNLHKPSSVATIESVPDNNEHMLMDDEPIELVGGSVETLSDVADATYEVNGTFKVPPTITSKNETYCKGDETTNNSTFIKPFDGTFDVIPLEKSEIKVNDTYDLKSSEDQQNKQQHIQVENTKKERGSRLSTDLAEQMRQKGLSPSPGLNSTTNNEKLLLNLTDLPSTSQLLFSETAPVDPINITDMLCLPIMNNQSSDSLENPLEKTLVEEQNCVPLESPSNEFSVRENPDQLVVVLRDTNREIIPPKQRFSLGLDLSEYVQDCSIELCDMSNSSSMPGQNKSSSQNTGGKQSSFEMDESLGILTPEQMKEFLDSTKATAGKHDLFVFLLISKSLSLKFCFTNKIFHLKHCSKSSWYPSISKSQYPIWRSSS